MPEKKPNTSPSSEELSFLDLERAAKPVLDFFENADLVDGEAVFEQVRIIMRERRKAQKKRPVEIRSIPGGYAEIHDGVPGMRHQKALDLDYPPRKPQKSHNRKKDESSESR